MDNTPNTTLHAAPSQEHELATAKAQIETLKQARREDEATLTALQNARIQEARSAKAKIEVLEAMYDSSMRNVTALGAQLENEREEHRSKREQLTTAFIQDQNEQKARLATEQSQKQYFRDRLATVKAETFGNVVHAVRVVLAGAEDDLSYDTLMLRIEDKIRALREQAGDAVAWQQMETAPKDGTAILIMSGQWATVGSWNGRVWKVSAPHYPQYPADEQPEKWKPIPYEDTAPPAQPGAVSVPREPTDRHVVMDGTLHIERQRFKDETGTESLEAFVGYTEKGNVVVSLYTLHSLLEHMNGQYVRVVIEYDSAAFKTAKATATRQPEVQPTGYEHVPMGPIGATYPKMLTAAPTHDLDPILEGVDMKHLPIPLALVRAVLLACLAVAVLTFYLALS